MEAYFTNTDIGGLIAKAISRIEGLHESDPFLLERNKHLLSILTSMRDQGAEWQSRTPINIGLISKGLTKKLESATTSGDELSRLFSSCFRFLKELDLSLKDSLVTELQVAGQFAYRNIDKWDPDSRDQILYALYAMPLDLLKGAQNHVAVSKLKSWTESAERNTRRAREAS